MRIPILALWLVPLLSPAQKVRFVYDANGNRTGCEAIVEFIGTRSLASEARPDSCDGRCVLFNAAKNELRIGQTLPEGDGYAGTLADMSGRTLRRWPTVTSGDALTLPTLVPGTYLFTLKNKQTSHSWKIVRK